jgi:hypothetical protein
MGGKISDHEKKQHTHVIRLASSRGVHKFFKTLAKLASSLEYLLAKSDNNWPNISKGSVRGGKKTQQASEWVCIFTREA